jgi:hypothetical protein
MPKLPRQEKVGARTINHVAESGSVSGEWSVQVALDNSRLELTGERVVIPNRKIEFEFLPWLDLQL